MLTPAVSRVRRASVGAAAALVISLIASAPGNAATANVSTSTWKPLAKGFTYVAEPVVQGGRVWVASSSGSTVQVASRPIREGTSRVWTAPDPRAESPYYEPSGDFGVSSGKVYVGGLDCVPGDSKLGIARTCSYRGTSVYNGSTGKQLARLDAADGRITSPTATFAVRDENALTSWRLRSLSNGQTFPWLSPPAAGDILTRPEVNGKWVMSRIQVDSAAAEPTRYSVAKYGSSKAGYTIRDSTIVAGVARGKKSEVIRRLQPDGTIALQVGRIGDVASSSTMRPAFIGPSGHLRVVGTPIKGARSVGVLHRGSRVMLSLLGTDSSGRDCRRLWITNRAVTRGAVVARGAAAILPSSWTKDGAVSGGDVLGRGGIVVRRGLEKVRLRKIGRLSCK